MTPPPKPHLRSRVEHLLLHDGLPARLTPPEQLHQAAVVNHGAVFVGILVRLVRRCYQVELWFGVETAVQRVD